MSVPGVRKRLFFFRLRGKLLLVLVVLLGAFSGFSSLLHLQLQRSGFELAAERRLRGLADTILRAPEPARVDLAAELGMTAFSWSSIEGTEHWSAGEPIDWHVDEQRTRWVSVAAERIQVAGRSGPVGWRVEDDFSAEAATIRQSARFLLLSVLLNTLTVVVVAALFLSRLVVRPVSRLADAMQDVKGPASSFRPLPEDRADELGDLTRTFNNLMLRLQDSEREKANYITKLEDAYRTLAEAQERIITTEKLASLGRLSAGIAHEIGNPLAAVKGYLSLLPELSNDERKDAIARAVSEANRIDAIIRGLLDFARPRATDGAAEPVIDLLQGVADRLRTQPLFKHIAFQIAARPEAGMVQTGGGRLEQVLINLCINAADAMAGQGQLTLTAFGTGDAVEIKVRDTGAGIARENLPHIFEPFFTTKQPGEGTGLGLALVHQIVTALHGTISVRSELGEGTEFTIRLPQAGA